MGKVSFKQTVKDVAGEIAQFCGFSQAMTYSFESPKVFDKLKIAKDSPLRKTVVISNPLGEDFSIETAVVFGELYKNGDEWKFNAIGSGYQGGLAALCNSYGVDVE